MKKAVVLVLALFYFVSVNGVAWNNFYCCGKLKETFLFSSKEAAGISKSCKGNKFPGCCDTKTFFSKVKDNHSPAGGVTVKAAETQNLFYVSAYGLPVLTVPGFSSHALSLLHAPPLISNQPVYLSVCTFRI